MKKVTIVSAAMSLLMLAGVSYASVSSVIEEGMSVVCDITNIDADRYTFVLEDLSFGQKVADEPGQARIVMMKHRLTHEEVQRYTVDLLKSYLGISVVARERAMNFTIYSGEKSLPEDQPYYILGSDQEIGGFSGRCTAYRK